MKPFNVVKRYGAKVAAITSTGVLLTGVMVGNAFAALPASVATDVTAGKADIAEAGGLALGILLAVLLFVWIRKVMR
jgi:hypothetical protein